MDQNILYRPNCHKDITNGYRNVETARTFSEWVVNDILSKYPKAGTGENIIQILAVDSSSTYLAAFIKMLQPNWYLNTSKKNKPNFQSLTQLKRSSIPVSIFVDDYFSSGEAFKACIIGMLPSGMHTSKLSCYFIDAVFDTKYIIMDILKETEVGRTAYSSFSWQIEVNILIEKLRYVINS